MRIVRVEQLPMRKMDAQIAVSEASCRRTTTPASLQSSNQCRLQSAVAIVVICHALCEMELLLPAHLHDETVYVSLS